MQKVKEVYDQHTVNLPQVDKHTYPPKKFRAEENIVIQAMHMLLCLLLELLIIIALLCLNCLHPALELFSELF